MNEAEVRCEGCGRRWWVPASAVEEPSNWPACPTCFGYGCATGRRRYIPPPSKPARRSFLPSLSVTRRGHQGGAATLRSRGRRGL